MEYQDWIVRIGCFLSGFLIYKFSLHRKRNTNAKVTKFLTNRFNIKNLPLQKTLERVSGEVISKINITPKTYVCTSSITRSVFVHLEGYNFNN